MEIRITGSARAHDPNGSRPLWGLLFGGGWWDCLWLIAPIDHTDSETNRHSEDYKYVKRDDEKAVKYAPHAL